jgi:hypothetical protein
MCGKRDRLHKAAWLCKIVQEQKHISVHLVCSEMVFETELRWLRWVAGLIFVAISGTPAWGAPTSEHGAQAEHHRRITKPHKNPAPHAKVAPKKKRPTVSHAKKAGAKRLSNHSSASRFSNHSSASPHKVAAGKKRVQTPTSRPASTARPLTDTKPHKYEPVRDFRDRGESEKPQTVKAPESEPKTKAITSPTPPKEPDVPTVQAPSVPNAPSSDKATD